MRAIVLTLAVLATLAVSAFGKPAKGPKSYGFGMGMVKAQEATTFEERLAKLSRQQETLKSGYLSRADKAGENILTLQDVQYYVQIDIGSTSKDGKGGRANGGQMVNVAFDTGSSNLWVMKSSIASNSFNAAQSVTYEANSTSFYIGYLVGNVTGTMCQDVVNFGGFDISKQHFAEATYQSAFNVTVSPCRGLIGAAWPSISQNAAPMPFHNLWDMHAFDQFMFQLWLNPNQQSTNAGELFFGGFNTIRYTGTVNWVPLLAQRWWIFNCEYFSFGTTTFEGPISAVADSGTSLFLMDSVSYKAVGELITSALSSYLMGSQVQSNLYLVQQQYISKLPSFTIRIGTISYTITPQEYVLTAPGDCATALFIFTFCIVALGDSGLDAANLNGMPQYILGDTFLRSVVTFHDYAGSRIGFAPSVSFA